MKTKETRSWHLANAEARHKESPATFHIPKRETRERVKVGFYVKLIFETEVPMNGCWGERMWVEVTKRTKAGYEGIVRNSPAFLKDIVPGEEVTFGSEHICDISYPDAKGG